MNERLQQLRDFLLGKPVEESADIAVEWVRLAEWTTAQQAVVFTLAALVFLISVWNLRRVKGLFRRAVLLLLRMAVLAVLLFVFYQPALLEERRAQSTNTIVLLADDSASMALPHDNAGTRRELVASFIRENAPRWRDLEETNVVESYRFSDELDAVEWRDLDKDLTSQGQKTTLIEVLEQLRDRYRNRDLGGIVILSDGIDNGRAGRILGGGNALDQDSIRLLREFEAPIYTFGVPPDEIRDIAVRELRYSPFAFKRNRSTIEAVIEVNGYDRGTLEVELLEEGKLVRSATRELSPNLTTYTASFDFTPLELGHRVYSVRVRPFPEEVSLENNERPCVIKVNRDKIRILQIAGHPSWDVRFVRNYLKRTPNIQLISFFILINAASNLRVRTGETALIPFPANELFVEELPGFDLVILQDFNYGPFSTPQHLHRIRDYVRDGGALMIIGGRKALGAGDYAGTELAEVLPVTMTIPNALDDALDNTPFKAQLTEAGKSHSVTRLSFDQTSNETLWSSLPELEGVNKSDELLEDAVVLVEHPTLEMREGGKMPVLALAEPGKGRVAMLATDSTWRWKMPAVDNGVDARNYDQLFDNMIRWLIKDPDLDLLRVTPAAGVRSLGEDVDLEVRAFNPDYRPAADHNFVLKVTRRPPPGDKNPPKVFFQATDLRTDEHGRWLRTLSPTQPGIYDVEARAVVASRQLLAKTVFVVSDERPEMREIMSTDRLLKSIATATGGTHFGLGQRDFKLQFNPPRVSDVTSRRYHERWNMPGVFLLAILLFSLEWWLRRRAGFV